MRSEPFFAVSNAELRDAMTLCPGDVVRCGVCGGAHKLEASEGRGLLLFYRCGERTMLAAVAGKSVIENVEIVTVRP